jgi:hypothetical protein
MAQLFTNNAISLLEQPLYANGLTIHVIPGDGALYPQPVNPGDFFIVTLEDQHNTIREIVKVIGRTGDILHIDPAGRGFENTPILDWPADVLVDHRITAFALTQRAESIKGSTSDPTVPNIVDTGTSKNTDTFSTSYPNNLSCKWIVTVLHELTGRISVSELLAAYHGPTVSPSFTIYAKTGDKLKYSIDVVANGTDMHLVVNNIDTVDFRINIIRINY